MKIFIALLLALSAGCSTTNHLSRALALNQGENNSQRVRYVARMQSALLKYVARETPDFDKYAHLEQAYVKWTRIGQSGWLTVASRSHHADDGTHRGERIGSVSVAIDSDGHFYYSLKDLCGAEEFWGQPYSTVLDFQKKNLHWDWQPLPSPLPSTDITALPTEQELTATADRYRERLEGKGVQISALKVFSDGSIYVSATPANGDLKPFLGLPFESLSLSAKEVTDLTPLLEMNLRVLELVEYQGSDLSSLSRARLHELRVFFCKNIKFSTLLGVETLRKLSNIPIYGNPSLEQLRKAGNLARNPTDKEPTKTKILR
jgi:hypothetical protein